MYPHSDDQCRQDSVDAAGFRDACQQIARLSEALGLDWTAQSPEQVVDAAIARTADAAARLAAVEALATDWTSATCQTDGAPCSWHRVAAECAAELRVALSASAPDAGQDREESCDDCGHLAIRHWLPGGCHGTQGSIARACRCARNNA